MLSKFEISRKVEYPRTCSVCGRTYKSKQSFCHHKRQCKVGVDASEEPDRSPDESPDGSRKQDGTEDSSGTDMASEGEDKLSHIGWCETCNEPFFDHISAELHKMECGSRKVEKELQCKCCNATYFNPRNYRNHVALCKPDECKNLLRCIYSPACTSLFYKYTELQRHLKNSHDCVDVNKPSIQEFDDERQFQKWLSEHQLDQYVYSVKRGEKITGEFKYYYYRCQRDAARHYKMKSETEKRSKKYGSIPKECCPARMSVRESLTDGKIRMEHYPIHSHNIDFTDVVYHRYPREIIAFVKREVANSVPCDVIRDKVRLMGERRVEESADHRPNVLSYFKERQASKIKYSTNKLKFAHPDDALAVDKLATSTHREDVFLYKPQNLKTIIGDPSIDELKTAKDLFAFGYQNSRMYDQWMSLGNRPICIDITHNTNKYGFYLINFVGVDVYGKGYLMAFIICNHVDEETLKKLIKSLELKPRPKPLKLSLFITDDDSALYNSVKSVFGKNNKKLRHILCLFHVCRSFRRNLNQKIHNTKICDEIWSLMQSMIYARRVDRFLEREQLFLRRCLQPDVINLGGLKFLNYYSQYWMGRVEMWAMCGRNFWHIGADTNQYVEAFHEFLKTHLFKRKRNSRLDTLIQTLLKAEKDQGKDFEYKKYIKCVQVEERVGVDLNRHLKGIHIRNMDVQRVESGVWSVRSQEMVKEEKTKKFVQSETLYQVERINESCCLPDHCSVRCVELECIDLCICMYRCSCGDRSPLCKHQHKVHSLGKRTAPIIAPIHTATLQTTASSKLNTSECGKIFYEQPMSRVEKSVRNRLQGEYEKLGGYILRLREEKYSANDEALLSSIIQQIRQTNIMFESLSKDEKSVEKKPTLSTTKKVYPNEKFATQPKLFKTRKEYGRKRKSRDALNEIRRKENELCNVDSENEYSPPPEKKAFSSSSIKKCPTVVSPRPTIPTAPKQFSFTSLTKPIEDSLEKKLLDSSSLVKKCRTVTSPRPIIRAACKQSSFTPPVTRVEDLLVFFPNDSLPFSFELSLVELKSLDPNISEREMNLIESLVGEGPNIEGTSRSSKRETRGWLVDSVIDIYATYLAFIHSQNLDRSVCAVPCRITCVIQDGEMVDETTRQRIGKEPLPILRSDILLFPFQPRPGKNHWTLLVLDISSSTASVLDPLHRERPPREQVIQYEKFIAKWSEIDERWHCVLIDFPPHVQQKDAMSCGVFVCYYVEKFLTDRHFEENFDVFEYRKRIYNVLTNNGTIFSGKMQEQSHDGSDKSVIKLINKRSSRHVILKDGDKLGIPIKSGDEWYYVRRTSCFDAIFHIIFSAYKDSEAYKEYVDKHPDIAMFRAVHAAKLNNMRDVYQERVRLFISNGSRYDDPTENRMISINPYNKNSNFQRVFEVRHEYHLDGMITTSLKGAESLRERALRCSCKAPRYLKLFSAITVDIPEEITSLSTLQDFCGLGDTLFCFYCKTEVPAYDVERKVGGHIFLQIRCGNESKSVLLSSIQKNVCVYDVEYSLNGVIVSASKISSLLLPDDHSTDPYIAFSWRVEQKRWEMYDGYRSEKIGIVESNIEICCNGSLIFYTKN